MHIYIQSNGCVRTKDAESEQPLTTQSMVVVMHMVNKDPTRGTLQYFYTMLWLVNAFLKGKNITAGVACNAQWKRLKFSLKKNTWVRVVDKALLTVPLYLRNWRWP